jgi:hypothetical protein
MFLTAEETGGLCIFSLREGNGRYLAIDPAAGGYMRTFNIGRLAETLGQDAGETWQEHRSLILLACAGGKLFEWIERCANDNV